MARRRRRVARPTHIIEESKHRRWSLRSAAVLLVLGIAGCVSTGRGTDVGPVLALPPEIRDYLLDPDAGLEDVPGPSRSAVDGLFERLVSGDVEGARSALSGLTGVDESVLNVIQAQLAFAAGRPSDARASLGGAPESDAGRLLSARLYEISEQPVAAVHEYWQLRDRFVIADQRVVDLLPRAVDQRELDLDRALANRAHDLAADSLSDLEIWAPEREQTRRAALRLARATGDPAAELTAWRQLARVAPPSRSEMFEWAELELTGGDADQALEISRALVAADREDRRADELLARAEFIWRTRLLPDRARAVLASPVLTRAELAVALYWLFPQARYAPSQRVRIASDILEHRDRDEIAQIINAGLLEVDPVGHRFRPDAAAMRSDALNGVAAMLRDGGAQCASGDMDGQACGVAAACGVIAASQCQAGDAVSGAEFADWARRAQERLTRP